MPANKYIFVAYYTIRTRYEKIVKMLQHSLDSLNLPYDIQGYPDKGTWQANIAFKPEFIFSMMCKHPDTDIVYVDADAIVRQQPIYFNTFTGDLGVHYKDGRELLSGTIYLKNSNNVKKLVKAWMAYQQRHPTVWDQKTLQRVISQVARECCVNVVNIPATYTQIYDTMKSVGQPVIEHFQASRDKDYDRNDTSYPSENLGIKIRKLADGTFCIPRQNRSIEKILDALYPRITGELRWYPRESLGLRIETMRDVFRGKICYLVGKGPSLDYLNQSNFPNTSAPIFGINEAIHKVESLNLPNPQYAIQQDIWLKETCRPKKAKMVLSYRVRNFYPDIKDRYIFYGPDVGAPIACLTASYAICIAKRLGCTGFVMVCFDSCINHATTYAKCIGYDSKSGGEPSRFLKHRSAFMHYIGKLPVEWTIPKVPA